MRRDRIAETHRQWRWQHGAIAVVTGCLVLGWLLGRPTKVELGDQGYQLTLALYSVCNQEDLERMRVIEDHLRAVRMEGIENLAGLEALERIVQMAKEGDWAGAMKSVLRRSDSAYAGGCCLRRGRDCR